MENKVMRPEGHPWREGLFEMLERLQSYGISEWTVVEIGTYLGESASIIARYTDYVWTVDPWDLEFMRSISENPGLTYGGIQEAYDRNTKGQGNITLINEPSLLAARRFADRSLDFVYIDGWHRVFPCVVDIITWLPKIKDGGFIGGHDYTTADYSEVIPATMYTLGRPDHTFPDGSWLKRVPYAKS